ncbi:MAG: DUF3597 family protein, partial [Anaerolineales bacterium]
MGLFDSILEKLGLKKPAAAKPAAIPTGNYQPAPVRPMQPGGGAIAVVDVVSKLEGMAKKYPMKLNWKESIVDLLVLLD